MLLLVFIYLAQLNSQIWLDRRCALFFYNCITRTVVLTVVLYSFILNNIFILYCFCSNSSFTAIVWHTPWNWIITCFYLKERVVVQVKTYNHWWWSCCFFRSHLFNVYGRSPRCSGFVTVMLLRKVSQYGKAFRTKVFTLHWGNASYLTPHVYNVSNNRN